MDNNALVLFNIVSVILTLVFAQDDFGGGEDAGSELDMESMLNTPGSEAKSDPNAPKPTVKLKTLVEESVSALQQLGFIIGNIDFVKTVSIIVCIPPPTRGSSNMLQFFQSINLEKYEKFC